MPIARSAQPTARRGESAMRADASKPIPAPSSPRVATMKTGVEARYLRNIGKLFEDCFDRREIVRLVKRGQRDKLLEFFQDFLIHDHRPFVPWSAMNNTMADTEHSSSAPLRSQPGSQCVNGGMSITDGGVQAVICEDLALRTLCR